jgi:hypothetical protein
MKSKRDYRDLAGALTLASLALGLLGFLLHDPGPALLCIIALAGAFAARD